MAAANESDRRYIQGVRLVTASDASDLEAVFELIGQGQQALVLIPSNMPRDDFDALTERLIGVADRGDAMISAIQVGSARPRGWGRWLARLNATRSFIVTPKVLGDPSVVVTWLPEAQTGAERLVVGELQQSRLAPRAENGQ